MDYCFTMFTFSDIKYLSTISTFIMHSCGVQTKILTDKVGKRVM